MKTATMVLVGSSLLAGAVATGGCFAPDSGQALEPGLDGVMQALAATPRLSLPPRPPDAPSGREVLEAIRGLELDAVEERLVSEVLAGNVPASLRALVPVEVGSDEGLMTVWVTPDYLSVGSDDDHFRVRLRAPTAERVVRELGAVLPTPAVADAIHRAAPVKLPPRAASETPDVQWLAQAVSHDRRIAQLLAERGVEPGTLVAGHMKDIVITPALAQHPGMIAIYGMHEPNGEPIQPLGLTHGLGYVDYSHGVRPVADSAGGMSSGQPSLSVSLQDRAQVTALSPEGSIVLPAYPASRPGPGVE